MDVFLTLLQALWFVWPAYCANAFPAVLNGKRPLDRGRYFGKSRLLGDSKTIEGTIGGILFGMLMGIIQMNVQDYLPQELGLLRMSAPLVALLSIGALVGDIVGSFIKRRLNIKPGDPAILLDQLGFLIFAFIFAAAVYIPAPSIIFLLIIITPIIHLLTNVVGYILKFKKNPW